MSGPEKGYAVVLGATSAMARYLAIEFGKAGYGVVLAARDMEECEILAADVRIRCAVPVHALSFEAGDFASHDGFFDACREAAADGITAMALAFGYMDEQANAQADFTAARKTIDVNLTGAVSITEKFAAYFEARRAGAIVIVSSVAGDRGRQSNYIYGASKAGLSAYAEGLRNRLYHHGVHVMTVKPGFVDTKMTWGVVPFAAAPEAVAKDIAKGLRKKRNTIYVPFFWRYIMLLIRHIPDWQFKKMKM